MKRLLLTAVALLCAFGLSIHAQTMTVSGSHLEDASGNLCAYCTITFQPVDTAGHPISFRMGAAGGQVLSRSVSASVVDGAFSIVLPDTSQTDPAHVCLAATVVDLNTGSNVLGAGYSCVQPDSTLGGWCSSTTCNFDAFVPNSAALPVTTINTSTTATVTLSSITALGTLSNSTTGNAATATALAATPTSCNAGYAPTGIDVHGNATGCWQPSSGGSGGMTPQQQATLLSYQPANYKANLLNSATATQNNYLRSDYGGLVGASGYWVSDFIPANSGGQMIANFGIFGGSAPAGIAYYDANKSYLSGDASGHSSGAAFNIPANAVYLRLTGVGSPNANNMLVNGSTLPSATVSYGTYAQNQIDAKDAATLATANANLAAYSGTVANIVQSYLPKSINLFDQTQVTANSNINNCQGLGAVVGMGTYSISGYMPVIAGQQYTIAEGDGDNNGCYGGVWYDSNKNPLSQAYGYPMASNLTLTAPAGAVFLRITGYYDITKQMVVQGTSVPGTYQPFMQEPHILNATDVQQFVTPASASTVKGCNLGVIGDSISSLFSNQWQNVVTSRTGCSIVYQDARPGRTIGQALECYGATSPTAGTLGAYESSNTYSYSGGNVACSVYNGASGTGWAPKDGNTLAQSLANVDTLIIELGTNDLVFGIAAGAVGDSASANTSAGNMTWLLTQLLTANPSMKIVWVGPESPWGSNVSGEQAALAAVAQSFAIPELNLYALGGVNSVTETTLLQAGDNTHPTATNFSKFYGPLISDFIISNR